MRGYLDTTDTSVTTVTVAGLPNAAYDVYVYADGDNGTSARTGAYRISGAGITATTINLTDAANTNFNATFTQATNSTGNYVKFSIVASGFTLTATPGAATGNKRAPVNAVQIVPTAPPSPDFAISSTPGSRTVTQGGGTTYTVTTTALNGFADTVDLAVTGLPANATATFTPASVAGSGNATLNVTTAANTPPGSSTLTITGTSGALTRTTTATLVVNAAPVPDFAVSATPAPAPWRKECGASYSVDRHRPERLRRRRHSVGDRAAGRIRTATFTPASRHWGGHVDDDCDDDVDHTHRHVDAHDLWEPAAPSRGPLRCR